MNIYNHNNSGVRRLAITSGEVGEVPNHNSQPNYGYGNPRINHVYTEEQNSGKNFFVHMQVDHLKRKALLDTGSQLNLVKKSMTCGRPMFGSPISIKGINGRSSTFGSLFMIFKIGGYLLRDLFHIVDDDTLGNFDFYLGSKFFIDNNCKMDFQNLKMTNKYFNEQINVENVKFSFPSSNDNQLVPFRAVESTVHNVFVDGDTSTTDHLQSTVVEDNQIDLNEPVKFVFPQFTIS